MTITQLEQYMISEIENLHLKMDEGFDRINNQMQRIIDQLTRALDRIDTHEMRIQTLEREV